MPKGTLLLDETPRLVDVVLEKNHCTFDDDGEIFYFARSLQTHDLDVLVPAGISESQAAQRLRDWVAANPAVSTA